MSFQKGDKVKIREDLREGREYHRIEIVTPEMLQYAGTETTIISDMKDGAYLDCDNGEWYWPEKTLIPLEVTNADKIRSMSEEELAEFLVNFKNTFGEEYEGVMSCLDWLREPAE